MHNYSTFILVYIMILSLKLIWTCMCIVDLQAALARAGHLSASARVTVVALIGSLVYRINKLRQSFKWTSCQDTSRANYMTSSINKPHTIWREILICNQLNGHWMLDQKSALDSADSSFYEESIWYYFRLAQMSTIRQKRSQMKFHKCRLHCVRSVLDVHRVQRPSRELNMNSLSHQATRRWKIASSQRGVKDNGRATISQQS